MRERKKTGVHGTLELIPLAWKFNSKQLLSKTLNSRMNIIETRAVLNIVKTDGKWAAEGTCNFNCNFKQQPTLKTVSAKANSWMFKVIFPTG